MKQQALCSVSDCGRVAAYKEKQLCQKHYFRLRRYGTTDTTKAGKAKERIETPNGYVRIYRAGHPLADKTSYVYEHRSVVWDMHGNNLPPCEMCGAVLTWDACHIDHIDMDRKNNAPDNLRPVCRGCNVLRGRAAQPEHLRTGNSGLTINGETLTPTEWSRKPGVNIAPGTIRYRLAHGASAFDAVYGAKGTHKAKPARVYPVKDWSDPRLKQREKELEAQL